MKIGLLSYHRNYNYGWNLQCYALMTVLKSMGHEVTLINKTKFSKHSRLGRLKKTFIRMLHLNKEKSYEDVQKDRGISIAPFFDKYIIPRTHCIKNKKGYRNLPRFDALVVGSDQVWRKKLVNPIEDYYFNFIDYPTRLISYAASFGVDVKEYTTDEIVQCGKLIERFNAVSVREQSGVKLIRDIYRWKCNPVVMPDPTLLLAENEYREIIGNRTSENKNKGTLFCYILDKTQDKEIAIEKLLSAYSLKSQQICLSESYVYPSVEEWLGAFSEADFIFTDSFHGCVFSLIFRKPFIAYGNVNRGLARFISLLDSFEQSDRLIQSSAEIDALDLLRMKSLEREKIDTIQNHLRTQAFDFLSSNLKP